MIWARSMQIKAPSLHCAVGKSLMAPKAEQRRGFFMPIFKNTQPIFFKSRRKIYGFHQSGCHGSSDARYRPRCRSRGVGCCQPHGRLRQRQLKKKKKKKKPPHPPFPFPYAESTTFCNFSVKPIDFDTPKEI